MALSRPTLLKWLRETFPERATPLTVADADAAARLRADLTAAARGREGLHVVQGRTYNTPQGWRHVCALAISVPEGRYVGRESVDLDADPEGRVFIRSFTRGFRGELLFPVASEAQLEELVRRADAWRQDAVARAAKRDKQRRLQIRALQARLEPVARDRGFEFALETTSTGVRVHLRSGERGFGEIHLRWKVMDGAVELLTALVAPLQRAAELGARIQAVPQRQPTAGTRLTWHPGRPPQE